MKTKTNLIKDKGSYTGFLNWLKADEREYLKYRKEKEDKGQHWNKQFVQNYF